MRFNGLYDLLLHLNALLDLRVAQVARELSNRRHRPAHHKAPKESVSNGVKVDFFFRLYTVSKVIYVLYVLLYNRLNAFFKSLNKCGLADLSPSHPSVVYVFKSCVSRFHCSLRNPLGCAHKSSSS